MLFDNFCAIDCTTPTDSPFSNMSCFAEGFITSTIQVDGLDAWAQCREKKTTTCRTLEDALDTFFDTSKIQGVSKFKALVAPAKDTLNTCKDAYTHELATFGNWVLGTLEDPVALGFKIVQVFFDQDRSDALADDLGDLINNVLVEHNYSAAGENFGLVLHDVFGSPSDPSPSPVRMSTFLQ